MRRSTTTAAVALAGLVAACEPPLPQADSFEPLSGQWIACLNDGAGDYTKHYKFYPDSFSTTARTYATTDRTCGGAQTGASSEIWRYRLDADVSARIGAAGPEVLARQMTIENSFVSVYTIVYVDGQSTPSRLYLGDLAHDPARDGTAPERRPTVLSDSAVFTSE